MSNDDLFDESNVPSFSFKKFEEVGDTVKGVYVGKEITPKGEGKYNNDADQENYILSTDDGYKMVGGRGPVGEGENKKKVIYGMNKIPLGAIVGFKFTEEIENSGKNNTKVVKPFYDGEKDEEELEDFQSKYDLSSDGDSLAEEARANDEELEADDIDF